MDSGWIKLNRSANTAEILKGPNVFALLTLIATRARRTADLCIHNLSIGEALIGDYKSCGLSPQQYRTAKIKLRKLGLVTFRTTNRGTIAKLVDKTIYDINEETTEQAMKQSTNKPVTTKEHTTNKQATTNNNLKKEKNERTATIQDVAVDDIPFEIKERFSSSRALAEFYNNCGQSIDIAMSYLDYVDKAKNVENPTGLAIKLAKDNKEQGPPLTASQAAKAKSQKNNLIKNLLNKIIWPVFFDQRDDLNDQSSKEEIGQAVQIINQITKQVIGKEKPNSEIEAQQIKSAIISGQFDLYTGQKTK